MSRYEEVVSRLDLWNIVLSTVVCEICFAESDTIHVFKNLPWSIHRRNPPCNAEDNLRAESSLKPGSGTTEGVLD